MHRQWYLILLAVLPISVAETVTAADYCLLSVVIEDHHRRFRQLYVGQSVTPKYTI